MTIDKYILIMLAVNTAGLVLILGRVSNLVTLLDKLTKKVLNSGNSDTYNNDNKND